MASSRHLPVGTGDVHGERLPLNDRRPLTKLAHDAFSDEFNPAIQRPSQVPDIDIDAGGVGAVLCVITQSNMKSTVSPAENVHKDAIITATGYPCSEQ
jgi:hypothetical protein